MTGYVLLIHLLAKVNMNCQLLTKNSVTGSMLIEPVIESIACWANKVNMYKSTLVKEFHGRLYAIIPLLAGQIP